MFDSDMSQASFLRAVYGRTEPRSTFINHLPTSKGHFVGLFGALGSSLHRELLVLLHLLSISEEEILFVQHQWKSGKPDTEVIQWPNQKQTRTRTPHFLETVCDTYQNPTFTRYVDGTLCVE